MLIKKGIYLIIVLVGSISQAAQSQSFPEITFPVLEAGKVLAYPFAGGMNAPQFSQADLNADGIRDVVVFDRAGFSVQTWLGTAVPGDTGLVYAPQYAAVFPPVNSWMLLRDFDQDGAMDVFTAGGDDPEEPAIVIYKGYFNNGVLAFTPFNRSYPGCPDCNPSFLHYQIPGNNTWHILPFSFTSISAIDDVDSDGDLDFLGFEPEFSNYLWYFKNNSVELGYGADSLLVTLESTCWGRFMDASLGKCSRILSGSADSCATMGFAVAQEAIKPDNLHPSFGLLTIDIDGDGDKDLLNSGVGQNGCLNLLINGGANTHAWMTQQDTMFPSNDVPVDLFFYPASYALDTDMDGDEDLLVASASSTITDDRHNVWHYERTGNSFTFHTRSFMAGEMIDVGTGAHPVFLDANEDGLTDMAVGCDGRWENMSPDYAQIDLYINKGTVESPVFELETEDWLGMSTFSPDDHDFIPAAADIDSDGDTDIIVGSTFGILYYFENKRAQGLPGIYLSPVAHWMNIDVGIRSTPFFYDLDEDGLTDLLLGERNGNINFFKNTGTATAPFFAPIPTIEHLGNINTSTNAVPYGSSVPIIAVLKDGSKRLVVGGFDGHIEVYTDPIASESAFTQVTPSFWESFMPGRRSSPSLSDINNDGWLELVIGNQTGGVRLFRSDLEVDQVVHTHEYGAGDAAFWWSTDPLQRTLQIRAEPSSYYSVYDMRGSIIACGSMETHWREIRADNWASGYYVLHIISQTGASRSCMVYYFSK